MSLFLEMGNIKAFIQKQKMNWDEEEFIVLVCIYNEEANNALSLQNFWSYSRLELLLYLIM